MVKGGAGEQEGEQGVPELLHQRGKKIHVYVGTQRKGRHLPVGNQLILKMGRGKEASIFTFYMWNSEWGQLSLTAQCCPTELSGMLWIHTWISLRKSSFKFNLNRFKWPHLADGQHNYLYILANWWNYELQVFRHLMKWWVPTASILSGQPPRRAHMLS